MARAKIMAPTRLHWSPRWIAELTSRGIPAITASKPTPALTLLATSSRHVCGRHSDESVFAICTSDIPGQPLSAPSVRDGHSRRCQPFSARNFLAGIFRQARKAEERNDRNESDQEKRWHEVPPV